MQCSGIGPHPVASRKSHGFSRVSGGTWRIFPSYSEDVHSKLDFVPGSQDTCLGMTDTSAMLTRVGWTIQILLEVKREIRPPLLVGIVKLGLLSIFKKNQVSSPFGALNSVCLSKCQGT